MCDKALVCLSDSPATLRNVHVMSQKHAHIYVYAFGVTSHQGMYCVKQDTCIGHVNIPSNLSWALAQQKLSQIGDALSTFSYLNRYALRLLSYLNRYALRLLSTWHVLRGEMLGACGMPAPCTQLRQHTRQLRAQQSLFCAQIAFFLVAAASAVCCWQWGHAYILTV